MSVIYWEMCNAIIIDQSTNYYEKIFFPFAQESIIWWVIVTLLFVLHLPAYMDTFYQVAIVDTEGRKHCKIMSWIIFAFHYQLVHDIIPPWSMSGRAE